MAEPSAVATAGIASGDEASAKRSRSLEDGMGKLLEASVTEQDGVALIDALLEEYGKEALTSWRDTRNKHRHQLIHMVVCNGWNVALEHLATKHKFDLNVQRDSDQCTAAHLAIWYKQESVVNKLWELGADTSIPNKYGESADTKWKEERDMHDNLIFLDLEFTCGFYEKCKGMQPKILEAAIIITGKDLTEKGRGQWVVGGFAKEELEALGEFHQQHFRDATPGGEFPPLDAEVPGNGLFGDILRSTLSAKDVEDQMVTLVRKHCPENGCPLVGYSVQCDREVLMVEMPRFYNYLSHQIVDLSSFLRMGGIWLPEKMKERQSLRPGSKYNHRALNDVEDSISTLAWVRDNLFRAPS